jgi:hypothetical protein
MMKQKAKGKLSAEKYQVLEEDVAGKVCGSGWFHAMAQVQV